MSSWLNRQQEDAFNLYRKYIAMNLHFKEGSGFDYSTYGGNTRLTLEGFLGKPMALKRKFIVLLERIKQYDHEDFLFANIKAGNCTIDALLEPKAMNIYLDWLGKYCNGNNYDATVKRVLSEYIADNKKASVTQLFIELFDNQNEEYTESIIWGMVKHPGLERALKEYAGDNIFHELNYKRIVNIKCMYLYFNIL